MSGAAQPTLARRSLFFFFFLLRGRAGESQHEGGVDERSCVKSGHGLAGSGRNGRLIKHKLRQVRHTSPRVLSGERASQTGAHRISAVLHCS